MNIFYFHMIVKYPNARANREWVDKFIYTHDILGRGPPSWTVMELCIPPLEEKTERPSKGPDQPKTKEEAVVRAAAMNR